MTQNRATRAVCQQFRGGLCNGFTLTAPIGWEVRPVENDIDRILNALPLDLAENIARQQAERELLTSRYPMFARQLADSRDRVAWAKARANRIGASDVAKYAKVGSAHLYLRAKLFAPFTGNSYTNHGNDREPVILNAFHIEQNHTLFHAAGNDRHVATPDGIVLGGDGTFILAQCKTSSSPIVKIKPEYQRQMWWEQYVMGTDRTLFVWEEHDGFEPVNMEPESMWFYRDDEKLADLIIIADLVLAGMDAAKQFETEMGMS